MNLRNRFNRKAFALKAMSGLSYFSSGVVMLAASHQYADGNNDLALLGAGLGATFLAAGALMQYVNDDAQRDLRKKHWEKSEYRNAEHLKYASDKELDKAFKEDDDFYKSFTV